MVLKEFMAALLLTASTTMGDIYQWQWVDPADHSLGKIQSDLLCPGGAGVSAGPRKVIGAIDLTQAYISSFDLSDSNWTSTTLTNAYFGKSNLYDVLFYGCSAVGADFTQVNAQTTNFRFTDLTQVDFTDANLQAVKLNYSTLNNANFTRADLSNSSMAFSTFYGTNFTDTIVSGVQFDGATRYGFTQAQLRSTASYKSHNLTRIGFGRSDDLSGWDFSGGMDLSIAGFFGVKLVGARFNSATLTYASFLSSNLASADFSGALLTRGSLEDADLTNANLTGADLSNANAAARAWTNANLTDAIITGADFSANGTADLTARQLYSTASYKSQSLRGVKLEDLNMTGWSFRAVDLSDADLYGTRLRDADFADATIAGTQFAGSEGFLLPQLYSTSSYKMHDLRGTGLGGSDLREADFRGVNFAGAELWWARLQNVDFTDANLAAVDLWGSDLRGARGASLAGARLSNTILPDGTAPNLFPDLIHIHNYSGGVPVPIRVTGSMHTGFIMYFDASPWGSTIGFDSGIPVDLTGQGLLLRFEDGVDAGALIGTSFELFDWTGVSPTGQFDIESQYVWDTSRLYTSGTVTLAAVPEPRATSIAAALYLGISSATRQRRRGYN